MPVMSSDAAAPACPFREIGAGRLPDYALGSALAVLQEIPGKPRIPRVQTDGNADARTSARNRTGRSASLAAYAGAAAFLIAATWFWLAVITIGSRPPTIRSSCAAVRPAAAGQSIRAAGAYVAGSCSGPR